MTLLELLREMRDSEGVELRKHHDGVQVFVRGMPTGATHRDGVHVEVTFSRELVDITGNDAAVDGIIATHVRHALTDARGPEGEVTRG